MRRIAFALAAASLLAQSPSAEVEKAERAFAALAAKDGTKKAFLHYLAEPSWILRPQAEDARRFYGGIPDDASLLSWRPDRVGVSDAGDLAFSTGPWEYRPKKDAKPVATGHFLSIWRKQKEGGWRVEVDGGVPHPAAAEGSDADLLSQVTRVWRPGIGDAPKEMPAVDLGDRLKELGEAEASLGREAAQIGWRALGAHLTPDAALYRPGKAPMEALKDKTEALEADGSGASDALVASGVSRDGGLGYTLGTAKLRDGGARSYFRVWLRGAKAWEVLIDLQLPLKEPAQN
jgi:ketosteroid isomerase-like protein